MDGAGYLQKSRRERTLQLGGSRLDCVATHLRLSRPGRMRRLNASATLLNRSEQARAAKAPDAWRINQTLLNRVAGTFRVSFIVVSLASCAGESKRVWPDWQVGGGDSSLQLVKPDSRTCSECIVLTSAIHVAIDSGPGAVDEARAVALDIAGRIWVGTGRGILIYSASGAYLQTLGRRGDGPGEFRAPGPIFVNNNGLVRFIDQVSFRETSFDSAFTFLGVKSLPLGPIFDAEALDAQGDTVLVNAEFFDVERVGNPAHIMAGGRVLQSFAMPQDSMFDARTEHMQRKVAVLPSGQLAIVKVYDYEVEVFARDGKRVLRFSRTGLWTPPAGGVARPLSPDVELHGFVQDVQADSEGRLWVLSWEPRADWRRNVVEGTAPDGTRRFTQKDSQSALRRSRIDVIDLHTGALVATTTHDAMLWGFPARGRLYGYTYAPTDEPRLEVFNLTLIPKS